jgi:hypothetical protein
MDSAALWACVGIVATQAVVALGCWLGIRGKAAEKRVDTIAKSNEDAFDQLTEYANRLEKRIEVLEHQLTWCDRERRQLEKENAVFRQVLTDHKIPIPVVNTTESNPIINLDSRDGLTGGG